MVLYSIGVSLDGFVKDRAGGIAFSAPAPELFEFHVDRVADVGVELLGRRLYETMLVWETDPSMRRDAMDERFADGWVAMPKVVFSRSPERLVLQGNARAATGTLAEEVAAAREATDRDIEVGGADLAGQAFEAGLLDELHLFRNPVVLGGGTPVLPAVEQPVPLALLEARAFPGGVVFERYRVGA